MLSKLLAFIFSLTSSILFYNVFIIANSFAKQKEMAPCSLDGFAGIAASGIVVSIWFPAIIIAFIGILLLFLSCYKQKESFKSFFNILSFLFLLPAIYSFCSLITNILIIVLIESKIMQDSSATYNMGKFIFIPLFTAVTLLLIYLLFVVPRVIYNKKAI